MNKLEAEAAAMREALEALGCPYGDELCFCSMSIGNPMLREHTPQCKQARAALSADAGRELLERLRRAERERDEARAALRATAHVQNVILGNVIEE